MSVKQLGDTSTFGDADTLQEAIFCLREATRFEITLRIFGVNHPLHDGRRTWKSKGCGTCQRRKIKCDGEITPCRQCRKSNRNCTGYQRDRHFKNFSVLDHDTLLVRAQPLVPFTKLSSVVYDESDPVFEPGDALHLETKMIKSWEDALKIDGNFLRKLFLDHYIPKERVEMEVSWLQSLPDLQGSSSLDEAMTALTLVRLERNSGDVRLRREGMARSGRALQGLQSLLSNPRSLYDEQTLAVPMTMSVFEVLEVSSNDIHAWTCHVAGISKLFQLRGPQMHATDSSHRLFLSYRPTGVIYDLSVRKLSYLGKPEWIDLPWKSLPKSRFHQLLDIMARMPGVIERTQTMLKDSGRDEPSTLRVADLLAESWYLHSELEEWHRKLLGDTIEPPYSKQPSFGILTSSGTALQSVFPTSLNFNSFGLARMHLFYWAALLLIYDNIRNVLLTQSLPRRTQVSDTFSTPSELGLGSLLTDTIMIERSRDIATLIAKSMEFLLSEDMNILGWQIVFFPLRVAMHAFSQNSKDEVEWCKSVFEELRRRGYPFGYILGSVKWDEIPDLLTQTRVPSSHI